jgi:hypothetical protein
MLEAERSYTSRICRDATPAESYTRMYELSGIAFSFMRAEESLNICRDPYDGTDPVTVSLARKRASLSA